MPTLEELMLTEEYHPAAPGTLPTLPDGICLPGRKRGLFTPGAPIAWTEQRGEWRTTRFGMVLGEGPRAQSAWAVPNEPRPGDGYAVLVRNITSDPATASRETGTLADCWSTEEWQNPRALLARAWLRRDRVLTAGGELDYQALTLHARDPECACAPMLFQGQRPEIGLADLADTVYVFAERFLHPWSILPMDPDSYTEMGGSRYVRLGRCFAYRPVHGQPAAILPDEVPEQRT